MRIGLVESGSNKSSPHGGPTTTSEIKKLGAGQILGRYTLLRRIAAGGMAEVYAARTHGISGFEKKVAIKKILPQFSLNDRFVDMLIDEAKITVSLTHPNIAQVYELGLEDDTYYIVMEYVDGRPLNRLLQKIEGSGKLAMPLEHAVHIMVEVTKGLYAAHHQRDARGNPLSIVHRDISPQNVLIAYSGDVKVIDFGIARAEGRAAQTSAGTIKGKLRYLAPEIAMGEEPDLRADIYCCGIVLFELLTGEALFAPRTDVEAIELASLARVRSPRASNPTVPVELEDIVMRSLARDRTERYATAKELYTDLRRFLNQRYPAYVGSELGDYMHQLFGEEIAEDRRLDALADKVIAQKAPEQAGLDELDAGAQPLATRYLKLVTRNDVSPLESPLPLSDEVQTESAQQRERTAVTQAATFVGAPSPPAARPEPALRDDSLAIDRASFSPRGPRRALLAFALGVTASIVVGVVRAGSRPTAEVGDGPTGRPVIGTAVLMLDVSPKVPVDVVVDGKPVLSQGIVPVELTVETEGREHDIEVRAERFLPKRVKKLLTPGNRSLLTFALDPELTTVELRNLNGGQVTADRGVVRGERVEEVPLGQPLHLQFSWPNAQDLELTLDPSSTEPLVVEVPTPKPLPKGTLLVNTRPYSEVWVDEKKRGRTPLTLRLNVGTHRVRMRSPTGDTRTVEVTVRAGAPTTVTFQWPR